MVFGNEFTLTQHPSNNDNDFYSMFQNNQACGKLICVLPNGQEHILRIHVDPVFANRSDYFKTALYGDKTTNISDCITIHVTPEQYLVLISIIIPYFYNQSITIPMGEEFVHVFSFATSWQMKKLLPELEMMKENFISFGRLYKLIAYYSDETTYSTLSLIPHDFFDQGMIAKMKSILPKVVEESIDVLLDFPYSIIVNLMQNASKQLQQYFFLFGVKYMEYIASGHHYFHKLNYTIPDEFWSQFTVSLIRDMPLLMIDKQYLSFSTVIHAATYLGPKYQCFSVFLLKYIHVLLNQRSIGSEELVTLNQQLQLYYDTLDKDSFVVLCHCTPFVSKQSTLELIIPMMKICGKRYPKTAAVCVKILFEKFQYFSQSEDSIFSFLGLLPLTVGWPILSHLHASKSDIYNYLFQFYDKRKETLLEEEKKQLDQIWMQFDCSKMSTVELNQIAKRLEVPTELKYKIIESMCVQNIKELESIDSNILDNKDFMIRLVKQNPFCLKYVSSKLQSDLDVVLAGSDRYALTTIQHVTELYEIENVEKICRQDIECYYFFSSGEIDKIALDSIQAKLVNELMQQKQSNNALHYYNIGLCYFYGFGVDKDENIAMNWFIKSNKLFKSEKAANSKPAFFVGKIYHCKKNYKKAMSWYRRAAHKNNPFAAKNIGYLYQQGDGVKMNRRKGKQWLLKAVLMGLVDKET